MTHITIIEGYKFFRRDRQGNSGRRVGLFVKKWIVCKELPLRNSQDQDVDLWVNIRDQINEGQLVVGVCYRPPD